MFVPVFSCTASKHLSCLFLCSVVQPEKVCQVFLHVFQLYNLRKSIKSLFMIQLYSWKNLLSVCSYVQLYSLKKSIATLIRALSEENPPDVNEEEAQSLSGVSTLKMFVYKFCRCTQNCLAQYV